jgi:hypothetical protein
VFTSNVQSNVEIKIFHCFLFVFSKYKSEFDLIVTATALNNKQSMQECPGTSIKEQAPTTNLGTNTSVWESNPTSSLESSVNRLPKMRPVVSVTLAPRPLLPPPPGVEKAAKVFFGGRGVS